MRRHCIVEVGIPCDVGCVIDAGCVVDSCCLVEARCVDEVSRRSVLPNCMLHHDNSKKGSSQHTLPKTSLVLSQPITISELWLSSMSARK